MKKIIKNIFKFFLLLLVAGIIFIAWANYSIKKDSEAYVSYNIAEVPKAKTALLLGTGKTLSNGMPNAYFITELKPQQIFIKAERFNISL
jgi:SanA protein